MKNRIQTSEAPAAIGPYSQGIKTREYVFTSGQIPIDPATGKLVPGGMAEQTARVMENAKAILHEAGCTLDNVVKTSVFITDMAQFAAMNEVYAKYFDMEVKPARSTVEVPKLALGALVEIEFIAAL